MMGGGPKKDKKFVNKIMKQIVNGATELYVVNDKDSIPSYSYDFAKKYCLKYPSHFTLRT